MTKNKSKTHTKNKKTYNEVNKNKTLKIKCKPEIPQEYKNITGTIDILAFKYNIN